MKSNLYSTTIGVIYAFARKSLFPYDIGEFLRLVSLIRIFTYHEGYPISAGDLEDLGRSYRIFIRGR